MRTDIFAHRGASSTHPENTMIAFREALRLGVDGIELDVHLTRDQQLVVIHDETLDRTTTGTGAIEQLTLVDILQVDAGVKKDARFAGERVPTLQAVFDLLQQEAFQGVLAIELKTDVCSYPGIEAALVRLVAQQSWTFRIVYSSFNHQTLVRIRELDPQAEVALLFAHWRHVRWRLPNGGRIQGWHVPIQALWLLRLFRLPKWPVRMWTVNEPRQMQACLRAGVSAMMTDEVAVAVAERQRWEAQHER